MMAERSLFEKESNYSELTGTIIIRTGSQKSDYRTDFNSIESKRENDKISSREYRLYPIKNPTKKIISMTKTGCKF